ncbi:MAG: tRNA pseudouridine(13) synthase TruD [Acidiferrobacterales bacterium]|nr:tRNA pseudouridine(13) synthase TruD [Acidiferrobacterales bacterium]
MLVETKVDWVAEMSAWEHAYRHPDLSATLKSKVEDFQVIENMDIEPTGEGEHIWLQITKQQQNTDAVAKAVARHTGVSYRDVGYSGLKDFNAITQQWFSVYLPKEKIIDWAAFSLKGVVINQVKRHQRKIKRGTHKSNSFKIKIRDLDGDLDLLQERVQEIKCNGVPNYFGAQRFGRGCNNMTQAYAMLVNGQTVKGHHLKSLYFSAARSWLFNCIVSQRIKSNRWRSLYQNEPTNLNGTNSIYSAESSASEETRLASLDIHPTAPLWGDYSPDSVDKYSELHNFEQSAIEHHADIQKGLSSCGLRYQRRPIRMQVADLRLAQGEKEATLSFTLLKGQFATSVMREIVAT